MKVNDAITGLVLVVFALVVFYMLQGAPTISGSVYGAGMFPRIVAGLMGACGLYMIAKEAVLRVRGGGGSAIFSAPGWMRSKWHLANFFAVILSLVVYILFSDIVGFDILGTIILFVLFALLRQGHLVSSFGLALVATFTIHYVFGHFLRVPLPWGILENYAFF